jgi:tetratricopeptide (TPR) repeat protein
MRGKIKFQRGLVLSALLLLTALFISCTAYDEETLILYSRAREMYSEGRFAETVNILEGMKKFHPGLVLRGKAEYFSGDIPAAEKTFRRSLSLRSSSVEARIYLARVLREQGKNAAAMEIVESVIADDPANIRALRLASDLVNAQGDQGNGEVLALLDRAVEAASETALVYVDRARMRWIMGNGKAALDDLDKARQLLPWESPLVKSIENLESVIKEAL